MKKGARIERGQPPLPFFLPDARDSRGQEGQVYGVYLPYIRRSN